MEVRKESFDGKTYHYHAAKVAAIESRKILEFWCKIAGYGESCEKLSP